MSEVSVRTRLLFCAAFTIAATIMMAARAKAQDAEPRSYTNTPIGLNFLIAGYLYTQGKIAFDPELAIADAHFQSHTGALAYVRSFDFLGQSAKFDVIVPYSAFSAHALVAGQDHERLDVNRRAAGHVAFGAGIHLCVGQMLARLEAEMLMMALAARVERIDIVGEPQRKLSNSLRQFASLPVELIALSDRK